MTGEREVSQKEGLTHAVATRQETGVSAPLLFPLPHLVASHHVRKSQYKDKRSEHIADRSLAFSDCFTNRPLAAQPAHRDHTDLQLARTARSGIVPPF